MIAMPKARTQNGYEGEDTAFMQSLITLYCFGMKWP